MKIKQKVKVHSVREIPNTLELKLNRIKTHKNKNVCVLIGDDIKGTDAELFFQYTSKDLDTGGFLLRYKADIYLSKLMVDIGICKSSSDAKGAGWFKKADDGFTDLHLNGASIWKANGFGRSPHRITILKKFKKTK